MRPRTRKIPANVPPAEHWQTLKSYLRIEQMLPFFEHNQKAKEILEDAMDQIWYGLTKEERQQLDDRD